MTLEELRTEIDAVDTEIVALLNRRASMAVEIGRIKAAAGMSVVDVGNAIRTLNRVAKLNEGRMRADTIESIFRPILEESRRIQRAACEQTVKLGDKAISIHDS